ncbi:MAG: 50S ribosomal protein L1 [Myxococcota bacterium]
MANKKSKRFFAIRAGLNSEDRVMVEKAVELVKASATAKFDEGVDVAVRLGVDPKHADQMVRGAVSLPHGTGKTVRVAVFAQGEAAKAAEAAGADVVGADDLVSKIQNENWLEFDKAVATRDMMGKVGRIGRVLGPRGLMPNPKVGTVVAPDKVADAVTQLKSGKIDFRVEKAGVVHAQIGRASMEVSQLAENLAALLATLVRLKPTSAKGVYMKSVTLSSTMGPGVRIDTQDALRRAEAQ